MKVYETLPPASPRAGFYRAVATWKDAAMLEFGPEGTMHYVQGNIKGYTSNLFTTGLKEHQIIFGDTDALESAIRDIDRDQAPELLFVVSSPVSEIIGTDLNMVCRKLQKHIHAWLSVWDNVPVTGTEPIGAVQAYEKAAQFLKDNAPEHRSGAQEGFLVLGLGEGDWSGLADIEELCRMMEAYFDLPCRNDRDGRYCLSNLAQAKWIIVAAPEALPLAQAANQMWGIPYFQGLPYGLSATEALVNAAAQALEAVPSEQWRSDFSEVKTAVAQFRVAIRSRRKRGIYLDARPARIDGWNALLSDELGLNVSLPEAGSSALSTDGSVGFNEIIGKGDILMGCGILSGLYPENPAVCIEYPVTNQKQFGRYTPFCGIRGVLNLLDRIYPLL